LRIQRIIYRDEYFTLQNIAKNLGIEIQPVKSETNGSLGQHPVKCKIIVYSKFLQHVQIFKYFGGEILYEN